MEILIFNYFVRGSMVQKTLETSRSWKASQSLASSSKLILPSSPFRSSIFNSNPFLYSLDDFIGTEARMYKWLSWLIFFLGEPFEILGSRATNHGEFIRTSILSTSTVISYNVVWVVRGSVIYVYTGGVYTYLYMCICVYYNYTVRYTI